MRFGDAYRTKGLELMARRSLLAQYLAYDYLVICDGTGTLQNMCAWYFPALETIWSNVLLLSDFHNMYKPAFFLSNLLKSSARTSGSWRQLSHDSASLTVLLCLTSLTVLHPMFYFVTSLILHWLISVVPMFCIWLITAKLGSVGSRCSVICQA